MVRYFVDPHLKYPDLFNTHVCLCAQKDALLRAAADGVSIEGVSTQPTSAFSVGDTVQTTRRKEPGVNQPGGVGTVTKVTFVKGGDAL